MTPKSHPIATMLNKITLGNISSPSGDKWDQTASEQLDPDKGSITSFQAVLSNLAPVGHSKKLPGQDCQSPAVAKNPVV